MPLQFPTLAEKCLAEWQRRKKTTSVNQVALSHGATRDDDFGRIVWVFDDDTSLVITGRGKFHKVTVELP